MGAHPTPARRTTGRCRADDRRASRGRQRPCWPAPRWAGRSSPWPDSPPRETARTLRASGHPDAEAPGKLPPAGVAPGGTALRSGVEPRAVLGPYHGRIGGSRTLDTLVPSQMLYLTELLSVLRSPIVRPTHAVRWLALARRTGYQNRNRCAATGLLRTLPAGICKSFRRTPDNKKPRKAHRRPGFGIPARKVASRGPPEPVFSSGPHRIHRGRAKMRCRRWSADDG